MKLLWCSLHRWSTFESGGVWYSLEALQLFKCLSASCHHCRAAVAIREVSCECIYWPFLHVSPGDTACMELLSFINWSSCLRAASREFFLSGITDLWAVFCRFVWCLVFWWSVRETWCYAERFFHLWLIW